MKSLLILPILFLFIITANGQYLSIEKLQKMRVETKESIGLQLKKKGWQMMSDEAPTLDFLGRTIWAYKPNGIGAEAWCILYFGISSPTRVLYNFQGKSVFNRLQKKVRKKKFMLMPGLSEPQGKEGERTYADYEGEKTVVRLFAYEQPNYFGIKIFDKQDYLKAKNNNRL